MGFAKAQGRVVSLSLSNFRGVGSALLRDGLGGGEQKRGFKPQGGRAIERMQHMCISIDVSIVGILLSAIQCGTR